VVVLALLTLGTLLASSLAVGTWSSGHLDGRAASVHRSPSSPALVPAAPRVSSGPFGTSPASAVFFQNDSTVANASFNSTNLVCWQVSGSCSPSYDPYTYSESTSPNLLALPDGNVGLSYQTILNTSQTICGWWPNQTISHVAFTASSDGGSTWGAPSYLGDSASTCPYNEEIEPSFTTNDLGSVLGVYVGANTSLDGFGNVSSYQGMVPDPISGYVNRTSDALIFVASANSGATFTNGTVLVSGANLARPAIAAFGRTVYIAYEDIQNSSILLPDNNSPIAVHLLVSTDSGASWGTALTLPGENASEGYTAMSPSLSVSATGELAVGYVTNRSCIATCVPIGPGSNFGDDVVAATSSNNGTSWNVATIFRATGEPVAVDCNGPVCTKSSIVYGNLQQPGVSELSALFQYAPPTSVAWNTTGDALFVAWGGAANTTDTYAGCFYGGCDFAYQSLYEATSADGGLSWSWQQLGAVGGSQNPSNTIFYNEHTAFTPLSYYDISLSVSGGVVYLAFQSSNASLTPSAVNFQNGGIEAQCGFSTFSGYNGATIEWLMNSSGGSRWSSPLPAVIEGDPVYWTNLQPYLGYSSSVLLQNGLPIVASSLPPVCPKTGCNLPYRADAYDTTSLDVATVDLAATVTLTVAESGLPAGTPWSVQVSGNLLSGSTSSFSTTVPGVAPFYVDPAPFATASGVRYVAYTAGGQYELSANGTVTIDFTSVQPFDLGLNGALDNFLYLQITNSTWGFGYYNVSQLLIVPTCIFSCASGALYVGCPMPWYFPTGYVLNVTDSDLLGSNLTVVSSAPPTYWAGEGAGNYTGTHLPYSVVMNDPINETMWTLPFSYYGVRVSAPNLPASSTFSFDWDGTAEAGGAGGGSVVLGNVPTGAHEISSIVGTSSRAGWIYVGSTAAGGTVLVPQQVLVNLSFAYIDVAAPAGTVSFHAQNLTNGTLWQLQFNGTTYSSSDPWINVTTHPGTFSVAAGTATSSNGSVGYVATGFGPEVSVVPGSVVPLNYSPAYKVTVAASSGGVVAPSGVSWYLPGQTTPPLIAAPASGFSFVGWSGTGVGSYNGSTARPLLTVGGPIVELASFSPLPPDRFDLNFTETGIPSGVAWQVDLGGTPYSSAGSELTIPGLNAAPAHYAFTVPWVLGTDPSNATRYVGAPGSGNVYAGTNFNNSVAYSVQHFLTLASTTGGSASAQVGASAGGSTWFTAGTSLGLTAQLSLGYTFVGWVGTGPGSYTGALATVTVTPSGSVSELATFVVVPVSVAPTYSVVFQLAQALAPGTDWTVTIGSSTYASTGSELNVSGLGAGTVIADVAAAYAPDGRSQYAPLNAVLTVHVAANVAPVAVTFLTSYWVDVQTVGPGTVSPGPGWVAAGHPASILATPASGDVLLSWTGTGTGAYSGASGYANFTVDGPITEVAAFGPPVGPSATAQVGGPFWTSAIGVVALALIGLAVGVALGMLAFRERSRRPPARSFDGAPPRASTASGEATATASPPTSLRSLDRAGSLRPRPSRSGGATAAAIVAVGALMLLSGLAGLPWAGAPAPGAPDARSAPTGAVGHPSASPTAPATGPGAIWLNTPLPNVTTNNLCLGVIPSYYYANQPLCGATNITNEPSLNLSSHGVLVAAYTAYTNETPCESSYPILANYTFTQIGLTTSIDGGVTWSAPQYLGNTVCTNATVAGNFANAWQPSVTSLANGTLVVAFVEFNLSYPTGCTSCYYPFPELFSNDWKYNYNGLSDYNSSQLVVSFSYDNGTSWTAPTPVNTSTTGGGAWCPSGCQTFANWIQQKPSLTAFGQTLYLTWTNITQGWYAGWFYDGFIYHYGGRNFCTLYHSPRYCPAGHSAVQLAVSLNGTPQFGPPIELPVQTASGSSLSVAANPSALVTPNGTLVVAYLSNVSVNGSLPGSGGSCAIRGSCGGFLSNVLVAQTRDNGSSWTVGTAASSVYDSQDYDAGYYFVSDVQDAVNAGDRLLPAPQATYDPVSQQVILAYTADRVFSYCPSAAIVQEENLPALCDSYAGSAVYVANGSLATNSWASRIVTAWSGLANSTPNGVLDSYFYNPAIVSTSGGTIFLTAQFVNGSACTSVPGNAYLAGLTGINFYGFQTGAFPYCGEGLELYGTSLDNGTSFTVPKSVDPTGTWYEEMPPGLRASMISAGNEVWVGWTQTVCPAWNGPNVTKCNMLWDYAGSYPPQAGFTSKTSVVVSHLFEGTGVTVTFQERGLPTSANWSVHFAQEDRSGAAGTNLSVSGVPTGLNESWNASVVPAGPGARYLGTPSLASPGSFSAATTIVWTYVLQYALTLNTTPAYPAGIGSKSWFEGGISCDNTSAQQSWQDSYFFNPNGVCSYDVTTINYNLSSSPGITWIDAGTSFKIQAIPLNASMYLCPYVFGCESDYANLTFQSWAGSGSGSYNGTANSTTLTLAGPVEETANFQLNGYCIWGDGYYVTGGTWLSSCLPGGFTANFVETGLPSGDQWGVSVWGPGPNQTTPLEATTTSSELPVDDPALSALVYFQPYSVPSGIPGKVWAGTADPGSPLLAPLDSSSIIHYALAPVSSLDFPSTVRAIGLPNGTAWSFSLGGVGTGVNGSSDNLTVAGGTHTLSASPVYLSNGTGYVPDSISIEPFVVNETWTNVSSSSATYDFNGSVLVLVNYTPIDELTVQASPGGSITHRGTSWIAAGASVTLAASADPGEHFVAWTGVGYGALTSPNPVITVIISSPTNEYATFAPNATTLYAVTVTATGVIPGGIYAVVFNGTTYYGSGTFVLPGYAAGVYTIRVPIAYDNSSSLVRFLPTSFSTNLPAGPGGTYDLASIGGSITIDFVTQYALQIGVSGSGTVSPGPGELWETVGNQTLLSAVSASGSVFVGWSGTGAGSVNSTSSSVTVTTVAATTQTAQFSPAASRPGATFDLTVVETGLPTGTAWSFSAGAAGAGSSAATASAAGLNGSYVLTVPTVRSGVGERYTSNVTAVPISVTSNRSVSVAFAREYLLTVAVGPGGSGTPGTEWLADGATIAVVASPASGYAFVGWTGSGAAGNYTGSAVSGPVTMGGPINESAAFSPISGPANSSTSGNGGGSLPAYAPWVAVAALLVVGLIAGYLGSRRGRGGVRDHTPSADEAGGPAGDTDLPVPAGSEVPSAPHGGGP
jgi:hypothetical protein